jgi:hypothetical protein
MAKKKTRLQKSTELLLNAKATQWISVNTDNEFMFMDSTFKISEDVEEYKVYKKAGEVEDFTNESYMEQILVVLDKHGMLKFYNQEYDLVEDVWLKP